MSPRSAWRKPGLLREPLRASVWSTAVGRSHRRRPGEACLCGPTTYVAQRYFIAANQQGVQFHRPHNLGLEVERTNPLAQVDHTGERNWRSCKPVSRLVLPRGNLAVRDFVGLPGLRREGPRGRLL